MNASQKQTLKKALSLTLFAVLVILLAWYVYQNRADMSKLLALDGATILWLLVFALGGCVMNCLYHRIILSVFNVPLSLTDWMGVVFVANAIAYVLPLRADLIFSATYYKRVKNLPYVKSVSMAAGNIVFGVSFALLQVLISLLCTGLWDGVWSATLWLIWTAGVIAVAAFLVVALLLQDHPPRLVRRYKLLKDVIDGFNALLRSPAMLWRLLACLIVNNLFQLLLYMTCFHAIDLDITIYQALLYSSVSWIATILTVVPGNIGLKEAVMGLATTLMGALFQNGVAVSLLQRVTVMVVYIVAGLIFAYPVWRNWNSAKERAAHE